MALNCNINRFIILLLAVCISRVISFGFGLEIDRSLSPRLINAFYNLHVPILTNNKAKPVTIDCNHPSVICKFGTSAFVSSINKECKCNDYSDSEVPIITGLETGETNKNIIPDVASTSKNDDKPSLVDYKNGQKDEDVPIFAGVINTDAILNEGDKTYSTWNNQKNSYNSNWKPSVDPRNTRIGELPTKFYSYYPFSDTPLYSHTFNNNPSSIPLQIPEFYPDLKHLRPQINLLKNPIKSETTPHVYDSSTATTTNPTIEKDSKSNKNSEVYPVIEKSINVDANVSENDN